MEELEEVTNYIGTFLGIFDDCLILSNEQIEKGKGYLVDLSKMIVNGKPFPIGERKPNMVGLINLEN